VRNYISTLAVAVAVLLAGGCGGTPKHTNTLIFGTNTKLALDVGADPTGMTHA